MNYVARFQLVSGQFWTLFHLITANYGKLYFRRHFDAFPAIFLPWKCNENRDHCFDCDCCCRYQFCCCKCSNFPPIVAEIALEFIIFFNLLLKLIFSCCSENYNFFSMIILFLHLLLLLLFLIVVLVVIVVKM